MTATQPETAEQKLDAFLDIDIGSIFTKGVIIESQRQITARSYQWTEGDPVNASRRVIAELGGQINQNQSCGTNSGNNRQRTPPRWRHVRCTGNQE